MCKKVIEKIIEVAIKVLEIIKLWIDYCANEPPPFEPTKWNDEWLIRTYNNCYNYACNIITNNFAQPGLASGNPIASRDEIECPKLVNCAISDGLEFYEGEVIDDVDFSEDGYSSKECGSCGHLVALFVDPDPDPELRDYHWYRRDKWGLWSHKPGGGYATMFDYTFNLIYDPRDADRRTEGGRNYSEFCGFFCVHGKKVDIEGPYPMDPYDLIM